MKKLFTAILLLAVATFASAEEINYTDWMSNLPDNMLVSQLSIPGAHDAGTSSLSSIAKTQSLNISGLLNAGVRGLDYRLSYKSKQLYIRHGTSTTSITGDTAFGYLKTFLDAHPTECLFVILKHEEDSESAWADAIGTLLEKYKSYLIDFKPNLTLGEMRGKILLMSRDTYTGGPYGAYFANGWSDNATSTNTLRSAANKTASVRIQDIYDGHVSSVQAQKKADLQTLLEESTTGNSTTLYINHTSGCNKATVIGSTVINTQAGMTGCVAECNQIVINYMSNRIGPMGIIMADYIGVDTYNKTNVYGKQLVDVIINNAYKSTAIVALQEGERVYQQTQGTPAQDGTTKLITSASQLSSNCPDPSEGTNMNNLIDNNVSTFFHSSWHDNYADYAPHDLQVDLPGNTYTVFWLKYTDRQNNDDHIKTMEVYGSNDGGTTYSKKLATINMPVYGNGQSGQVGFVLGRTPYTHYKFAVTETAGSQYNRIFFHCAEFQLYKGKLQNPVYVVDATYVTALGTALDNLQTKFDAGTATQDDIDAVYDAINAVLANTSVYYKVHITGAPSGTHVTIDTQRYTNNASFSHTPISEADVIPENIHGYVHETIINGKDINITYSTDWNRQFDFTGRTIASVGAELTAVPEPSETQWYVLKQNRDGEYPACDNGLDEGLTRSTSVSVVAGKKVENVKQCLVRLVRSSAYPSSKAFNIQFGTGRYFKAKTSDAHSAVIASNTPASYLINTATQNTSGWTGHFAINETSNGTTYGRNLDTNGSNGGYTINYWSSGMQSSGTNNIWALYPVTFSDAVPEIEEVVLGEIGAGTFSSYHPLDFSQAEGLHAYICSGVSDDGKLTFNEVTGSVPANTGLYVTGEPGTHEVLIVNKGDVLDQPNLLVAVNEYMANIPEKAGYTNYVLQNKNSKLGFYRVNYASGQTLTMYANRAYLQLPNNADAKEWFDIDDNITGINDIVNSKQSMVNGVYDISGRKVNANYKGVVIVNGKKEIRR